MPAKKTARSQERRRIANRKTRSSTRTAFKKASRLIKSGAEEAAASVTAAVRLLDRAVSKGVIHRNSAARRKSSLMRANNKR
mgnify:FL=1